MKKFEEVKNAKIVIYKEGVFMLKKITITMCILLLLCLFGCEDKENKKPNENTNEE